MEQSDIHGFVVMKKTITIVGFGDSITEDKYMPLPENRWLNILERNLRMQFTDIHFSVINNISF